MMPETTMHIEKWDYTKVITTKSSCVADLVAVGLTASVETTPEETRETVKATFALENALAFTRSERYGRSDGQKVVPTHLIVEFASRNGEPWAVLSYHDVEVIAFNLLKKGGLGALADVHPTWVPESLRELAADAGLKWVSDEYPR